MKRKTVSKTLSLLLTLCMVLSLLPSMALAAEEITPNPTVITAEEQDAALEENIEEKEEEPAEEEMTEEPAAEEPAEEEPAEEEPAEEEPAEEEPAEEEAMVAAYMDEIVLLNTNGAATEVSTWAELSGALYQGKNAVLGADITANADSSTLQVPKGVEATLDLNGHTINRGNPNAKSSGNVIIIQGKLTIKDTSATKNGKITGGNSKELTAYSAGAVYVNNGELRLEGGSITGNTSCAYGGGVSIPMGTFTMTGGSITNNTAVGYGGGVAIGQRANVELLGGTIENNTTTGNSGGGVHSRANFTIGGNINIQDNKASVSNTINNVQLGNNTYLKLSETTSLTPEAKIGWTPGAGSVSESGIKVAQGANAANYLDNFVSDRDSTDIFGLKTGDAETIYCATKDSTVVTKPGAPTPGAHTTRTIPLDVTTLQNITDTNGNKIDPTTDTNGDSIYNCESEGWSYRLNSSKQIFELTLSGVNFDIKNTDLGWAIIAPKVILADDTENRVSTVSSNKTVAAINAQEITGSGSLTVSAKSTSDASGASCYGIYSIQGLTLNQCSIVVDGVTCANGSASGIYAAMGKTLTIMKNAAKDNKITIKNVQGNTTKALGAAKNIVAEGAFVSGARDSFTSGSTKNIYFQDPSVPVIVSFVELPSKPEAATFTDGFGNTIENAASYTKGTTKNDKGYTFAGWFDGDTELENAGDAVAGKTYTAKWTKNGKIVRTTALDFYDIPTTGKWKAGCTQNGTLWTNEAEGWSWDTASKTLTLNGVTIDIPETNKDARVALWLPHGGTVKSDAGTQNTICNRSGIEGEATGLKGFGVITIDGSGELSITGKTYGIISSKLTIKAPLLTATAINEEGVAVACSQQNVSDALTLDSSVSITTPAGGKVCKDDWRTVIGDSNGTPAKEVVIGAKGGSTKTPIFTDGLGNTIKDAASYTKGTTKNDKGYTFAGWFGDDGKELTSADNAETGKTYTAKWTKNGKIVRTTALDLTKISESNTFGATLADGVYTNAAEGWSWNSTTKTLTLSGATMDIPDRAQESQKALAAVCLPDGAIITTTAGTQNTLSNSSMIEMGSSAVLGMGAVTVNGSGSLSVSGTSAGFYTMGNLAIHAPISATTTTSRGGMAVLGDSVTIDSSLSITTPAGGKVVKIGRMTGIADSEGTFFAAEVVISAKGGTENPPSGAEETYSVSGQVVKQEDHSGISGAAVTIKNKNVEKAVTTDSEGKFTVSDIPSGEYNIVVESGTKTVTKLVTITNSNVSGINVVIPTGDVSSVVETTGSGTPKVLVGGLDTEATNHEENGKSVVIKLNVEKKEESAISTPSKDAIKAQAASRTLEYLDMTVNKTVNGGAPTAIANTTNVLEIIVPYDMNGKYNFAVYRYHDGASQSFERLNSRPASGYQDGTFFIGDNFIVIYTQKFSEYAIGYNTTPSTPSGSGSSGGGGGTSTYSISVPDKIAGGKVSISPKNAAKGATVTITVEPEENQKLDKLIVTDKDGNEIKLTKKSEDKYTFVMPAGKVLVDVAFKAVVAEPEKDTPVTTGECPKDSTCPMNLYKDVKTTEWYHDGVHFCIDKAYMTGYPDGTFQPNTATSRAMIVSILWRMEGKPVVNDTLTFNDVKADEWYTEAIRWAASNKVVNGYSDTTFAPNDAITREQMMTILWNYCKYKGYDVSVGEDTNILSYKDANNISGWAVPAMQWACGSGLIYGMDNNTLDAQGNATRAQAANILYRFAK